MTGQLPGCTARLPTLCKTPYELTSANMVRGLLDSASTLVGAAVAAVFLSRAGVQTYGYLPLKLPEDFDPFPLVHNADERVPADALGFGVEAITEAIARYPA